MSQIEIKTLKIKLTTIKTKLTKFNNFVISEDNQSKFVEIRKRLQIIEPCLTEFEDIHIKLTVLDDAHQEDELTEFNDKYFEIICKAESILAKETPNLVNNYPSDPNIIEQVSPAFKLPDIKLPTFSGLFTDWITFRDSYQSLIHNNNSLTVIQKFHYLRSSLLGEAYETIEHLTLSNDNYVEAWNLLEQRYENIRLITQHHIKTLFQLPEVNSKDYKTLRQLLHIYSSNIKALASIKRPVQHWDDLLIHLITSKFDHATTLVWESTLTNEIPSMQQMEHFLNQRCQMLEALGSNDNANHKSRTSCQGRTQREDVPSNNCKKCKQNHFIHQCREFLNLSVADRIKDIKRLNLCKNCFRGNHNVSQCLAGNCKKCGAKHNTLLHLERHSNNLVSAVPVMSNIASQGLYKNTLLSTVIIKTFNANGETVFLRALLDSGSQSHFITEKAREILNIPMTEVNIPIVGIGNNANVINYAAQLKFQSRLNTFSTQISCLVVKEISLNHPIKTFDPRNLHIPNNIKLADNEFYISKPIDILIGNGIFWNLIKPTQLRPNGIKGPIFQDTHLGYIVSATILLDSATPTICNLSTFAKIEENLKRFWEIEEFPGHKTEKPDTCFAEVHFANNTSRIEDGRFMVKLPLINDPPDLGDSKETALKRFFSLEKKFQRDGQFRERYLHFMKEYEDLKHMELVPPDEVSKLKSSCYLPHHGVIKESSATTKLRVVFDGSAKTSNNKSLNEIMAAGPPLQPDLFLILLKFRIHKFIISGDIEKMYRNILVHPDHRNYQLIFWRDNPKKPINTYRLKTVTYGLTSAPFLAIRSIHELAAQEAKDDKVLQDIIINDTYVDDVLTGCDTIENALEIRNKLIATFKKGGFNLRKLTSNCPSLVTNQSKSNDTCKNLDMQSYSKTLGIFWKHGVDTITFTVDTNENLKVTKRSILSVVSRFYDPLGLVAPITIVARIILQRIWVLNLDWDQSVPGQIKETWIKFIADFNNLSELNIPRYVIPSENIIKIELHGFSDASNTAYGACIYVRTISENGKFESNLLCSKTKVAPIKVLTTPRLELCAAVLLVKLMNKIKDNLKISISNCLYWTDSQIVLSWINMQPYNLKIFVAHRISEIQRLSTSNDWHYVQSAENPADLLSRGTNTNKLISSDLWFKGPQFLTKHSEEFVKTSKNIPVVSEIPEMKTSCCLAVNSLTKGSIDKLLHKFSSFYKLIRVVAYCQRFIQNCKYKTQKYNTNHLSVGELQQAERTVLKILQKFEFAKDIHDLQTHGKINNRSRLSPLCPFLDEHELLRVGGRLKHANISYDNKHPILLPKNHFITKLIIKQEHVKNLHTGCQSTLAAIRRKYWPISGINSTKQIIKACVTCAKIKPVPFEQLMGDLPKNRVIPSRPFLNTGIDYAGPIILKDGHLRTTKTVKSYIIVFVCFATKACHLELVCDCTSNTFLNALKRFIGRRGNVYNLYSDNAKTFVGANRELIKYVKDLQSKDFHKNIINFLTKENISWHNIPPRSPHMGGLWEAAVKSVKSLLKRVIGKAILNYEEMYTVLVSIESILNSRPLYPLSNDPSDLQPLTPGHFLIGDALRAPSQPDILNIQHNRLSRFQLLEQIRQSFWRRWSRQYLQQLQNRQKWRHSAIRPPQVGDLVVLHEEHVIPMHWQMGRITELHPGSDGQTRVVTVQTVRGLLRRSIQKVCLIPLINE